MREHGWDEDAWLELFECVMAADIVVIGDPIWLGDNSRETKKIIERLYAHSADLSVEGSVGALRERRWLSDHRQRGRHKALCIQRVVQGCVPCRYGMRWPSNQLNELSASFTVQPSFSGWAK